MATKEGDLASSSTASMPPPPSPPTPPDGGVDAWLQVVGSFFINFNIWGLLNAFGAFEAYYLTTLHHSTSDISWIGSVEGFLLLTGGALAGPLFDLGHFRWMLTIGCLLLVFGVMMLSLSDQYYQVFLTQGVCIGLSSALLYTPSLALVAGSFSKRRGLAISLSTSGATIGGVIYPIMFRQLQPSLGFGWAVRIMGFVALACCIISIAIMLPKNPPTPPKVRSLIDSKAFTEPAFAVFCLAAFMALLAYYVPFFFITPFAEYVVGASPDLSFYLLAIVNAASFPGRLVPGFVADKLGALPTLVFSMAATGILILCWIPVQSSAATIVWAILFGFFSGGIVALPAACVPLLCPSPKIIGTRMGIAYACAGIGILVGNPIAGVLTDSRLDHFAHAQGAAGAFMLFAAICEVLPAVYVARRSAQAQRGSKSQDHANGHKA